MVRLRAHHLMCIQGFRGHGYDPAFTAHLGRIAAAVALDPSAPVTVVDGVDDVCAGCPNRAGEACAWPGGGEEDVRRHDALVMDAIGLRPGDSTSFAAVADRLRREPTALEAVLASCRACRWAGVCGFVAGQGR